MRSTLLLSLPLLAAAAFLAGGCDSSTAPEQREPHSIRVVSGDGQTGTVAQRLAEPLVVWVLDRHRRPVAGRMVSFTPIGGGSVAPGSTTTDAHGLARAAWTLGTRTAEVQQVRVTLADAAGGTARVAATFGARTLPDVPEGIEPDSACACDGTTLPGTVGLPLQDSLPVRVMDRFGNPVSGAAVVWRVTFGGGSISPEESTTGSDGVARALWTLGPRMDEPQVVEAAAGLTLRTAFYADAKLGAGARLVKISGDGQAGPAGEALAESLRVSVHLPDGRPVVGAPVSWTGAGGASFSPPVSGTDENGEATTQWTLGEPLGAVAATAAVEGGAPVVFTASAVLAARRVRIVDPDLGFPAGFVPQRILVGAANSVLEDPLGAFVSDLWDRPVAGVEVNWGVSKGSVSPAVSVTDAAGIARAQWTLGNRGDATAYATIKSGAWAPAPGFAVGALYKGPADSLLAATGEAVEVSVETAEQSFIWYPISGALVRWTVLSGGGSVASATSRTGRINRPPGFYSAASMRWTLGSAGPQTLRATLGSFEITFTATSAKRGSSRIRLTQVPGVIVDATRERVLWLDASGTRSLKLRDVASGTDVTLVPNLPPGALFARLFSAGALFVHPETHEVYEWRSGTLSRVGLAARGVLQAGEWAAWQEPDGIHRRNLGTGETSVLPIGSLFAVAANGDLVFQNAQYPWDVCRYRSGVVIRNISRDAVPYADEVNVVIRTPSSLGYFLTLILGDPLHGAAGLGEYHPAGGYPQFRGVEVLMSAGWTAWTEMYYPSNLTWHFANVRARRLPVALRAGQEQSKVEALAPNGTAIFRTSTARYLDIPGGMVSFLGPPADTEWVFWGNGAFLLADADGSLYELIP